MFQICLKRIQKHTTATKRAAQIDQKRIKQQKARQPRLSCGKSHAFEGHTIPCLKVRFYTFPFFRNRLSTPWVIAAKRNSMENHVAIV